LLGLSANKEFGTLAVIVADIEAVAAPLGVDLVLIGATAREVMLQANGLDGGRRTEDVDFAFMVANWETFETLRAALLNSNRFVQHEGGRIHKLRHAVSRANSISCLLTPSRTARA